MEKILIIENNPSELERLVALACKVIERLKKNDTIGCIGTDSLGTSLEIIQRGVSFLITNFDLGRGVYDWQQTGIVAARVAWQSSVPRHKICIYSDEFPDWIPEMAGVARLPHSKLDVPFLEFFIPESSVRPN